MTSGAFTAGEPIPDRVRLAIGLYPLSTQRARTYMSELTHEREHESIHVMEQRAVPDLKALVESQVLRLRV